MVNVYLTTGNYYKVVSSFQNYHAENFIEELKSLNPNIKKIILALGVTMSDIIWHNIIHKKHFLYLKKTENIEDAGTYVYRKGKKYVYHLYKDCKALNNFEYLDFKTPIDILERKDKHFLNSFREWFKSNYNEISLDELVSKYNSEFCVENHLKPITTFEKETIKKFKIEYFPIKQNFNVMDKEIEVNELLNNFKERIEDKARFKSKAIELILEYFFWYFEDDIKRDNDYLVIDNFGLSHCLKCEARRKEDYNKSI